MPSKNIPAPTTISDSNSKKKGEYREDKCYYKGINYFHIFSPDYFFTCPKLTVKIPKSSISMLSFFTPWRAKSPSNSR